VIELLVFATFAGFLAKLLTDWKMVPISDAPPSPPPPSGPSSGPSSASSSSTPPNSTPPATQPTGGARAPLVPRPASGNETGPAGRVPGVAKRIADVWRELFSSEIPPQALEIALAQAWLESGIADSSGGWWADKTSKGAGNMTGSGNLGARQCGTGDHGGDAWTCVPYGDSRPATPAEIAAGKPAQISFPVDFRYYKAGQIGGKQRSKDEAAAFDFVTSITKQWPAKAELESGDVLAYAEKQYRNHYYGGFGSTPADRIAGYAKAIADHLPPIASALGYDKVHAFVPADLLATAKSHASSAVAGLAGVDGDELDTELEILGALGMHPRHWLHLFPFDDGTDGSTDGTDGTDMEGTEAS
jgi:hypothetical protein